MKLDAGVALFSCSLAFCCTAPAQTPTRVSPPLRAQSSIESTVVLAPALVRDAGGHPVFALKAGDFRVTDDGVEQQLQLDEDTGAEPLALVIAVQIGGAGGRKLDAYHGLGGVLSAIVGGAPHRIAVVAFDSSPQVAVPFAANNVDAASAALQNLEPGDHGAAILDALSYSVYLLRSAPVGYRRAILLLSETIDHSSRTPLKDSLRSISDTNTAIYSAAFSSTKSYAAYQGGEIMDDSIPGPAHGCFAKDPNAEADEVSANRWVQYFDCLGLLAPPLRAAKLAVLSTAYALQRNTAEAVSKATGGEYFRFNDRRSLERALITLSHHLPNRYVLSFQPKSAHPGFHAVELRLKNYPSLHVSARTGYWVDEETVSAAGP